MPNILRPRKRIIRFENINKYKRKLAKVYYIVKNDLNVYIDDTTNHGINNPIPISTSY